MRKIVITLGLALMLTTCVYGKGIVLNSNDAIVSTPVPPIQEAGTTLVPLRIIGEDLGVNLDCDVQWDSKSQTVYIGESKADMLQSQGKMIYKNGDIEEGRFEYGEYYGDW